MGKYGSGEDTHTHTHAQALNIGCRVGKGNKDILLNEEHIMIIWAETYCQRGLSTPGRPDTPTHTNSYTHTHTLMHRHAHKRTHRDTHMAVVELCWNLGYMTRWLNSLSDSWLKVSLSPSLSLSLSLLLSLPLSLATHQVGGVRSVTLPESLLFVSTLDGSLHAVSKQSGDIKWTLREGLYIMSIWYIGTIS